MFGIVCTSDCLSHARAIADCLEDCAILDFDTVLADPSAFEVPENLGIVFSREDKGIPAAVASFIKDVLGNADLQDMKYMFSVCVCDKPYHALRIVEMLCAKQGCAPSLSIAMKDASEAPGIAKKIASGDIVLAGSGIGTVIYMKRHKL